MKCFRSHEYVHVAALCPARNLLINDAGVDVGNLEEDVNEPKGALVTQMRKLGHPICERVSLGAFTQQVEMRIGRD